MKILNRFFITVPLLLTLYFITLLSPNLLRADSMRLLTDLEYRVSDNKQTIKATDVVTESWRGLFSQLYSLDLQKQFSPTLGLNAGGTFLNHDSTSKVDGESTDDWNSSTRPYIDLNLNTPILGAVTAYRKSQIKQGVSNRETSRRFTEEYAGQLNWKPVELPELDLYLTRSLAWNEPTTTEQKTDTETDTVQLISRYDYQNYRFNYNYMHTDYLNKVAAFNNLADSHNGSVRYNNSFQDGKYTFNGNVRLKYDSIEFRGNGDRRVPTSSAGTPFANLNDPPPATSNVFGDFNDPLININLLKDAAQQLSFGLDYIMNVAVDTLYVNLVNPDPINNSQATEGEVDGIKNGYVWSVYVSDDQLSWTNVVITAKNFNVFENRFEISFAAVDAPYVKIAVTPLPTLLLPGKEIRIANLTSLRTLPADVSEFTSTEWTTDFGLNWKISAKTDAGFNLLYREERTEPFDNKRSLFSTSARVSHRFNPVYFGNLNLSRAQIMESDQGDRVSTTFSAALVAKHLPTFDQQLTYSFAHADDQDDGVSINHSLLLRNNFILYEGWSLYLDGSYSLVNPANGRNSDVALARLGSNLVPNRWMNFTCYYDSTWTDTDGEPFRTKQSGRLIANWVPLSTISMTADILRTEESGKELAIRRQYFINWAPFPDGTLQFRCSYAQISDSRLEDVVTISPSVRWSINRKTALTAEYSTGTRESETEKNEFESTRIDLRFFY